MTRNVIMAKIRGLSAIWTLGGWVILAAGSGAVLTAIAGHNQNEKSHPDLQQRVELLTQKTDLIQQANTAKFNQIDEKLTRMLELLDNLTIKVDAL